MAKKFHVYVRDNAVQAFEVEAENKAQARTIVMNAIDDGTIHDEEQSKCMFINLQECDWVLDSGADEIN